MKKTLTLGLLVFLGAASFSMPVWADTLENVVNTNFAGPPTDDSYTYLGFAYRPNANHNICTVQTAIKAHGSPSDALILKVYRGDTTPPYGHLTSFRSQEDSQIPGTGYIVRDADSGFQITATSTYEDINWTFTPCLVVSGGTYYNFVIERSPNPDLQDATNYYEFRGGYSNLAAWTNSGTGSFLFDMQAPSFSGKHLGVVSPPVAFDVSFNGTENFSNFVASTTTGFSSTTCTPPNSILDVGGGVSYSLCYMFVPNALLLNQFSSLGDYLGTKQPFVTFNDVVSAFYEISNSSASSSPTVSIDFSSLVCTGSAGGSCDSAIKDWLPSSFTIFSTSSLAVFLSGSTREYVRSAETLGLFFLLALYFFNRVRGLSLTNPV